LPLKNLVIASNNQHKIVEIKQLFLQSNLPFILQSMHDIGCYDDIAETAETIEGNASLKAIYIANKYSVNCFADDSGLEVKALNGKPGVHSARFAGEQKNDADNCNLLLQKMLNEDDRTAQFKTIISLRYNKQEYLFEGIIKGKIAFEKLGESGFGYDPLFIPENETRTFAQMLFQEKNKISHRAIATNKLIQFLKLNGKK